MTIDIVAVASTVATTLTGIAIGVISFFLKRTITQLDSKACASTVEALGDDVGKLERAVEQIRQDYITKEDFFREQAKVDKKLERIMDILLEMKGDRQRGC